VSEGATDGRANAVEVRGLAKVFNAGRADAVEALLDIDLIIAPGEFVSLIGPSGCGKSTQLRLIANLTEPTRGEVLVNGKPARRARLDQDYGMAFQQAGLFEWRSVAKNVELPLELKGWDRAGRRRRAFEMLELVKLREFAEHFPWQLSGGMQQRVAIARTLQVSFAEAGITTPADFAGKTVGNWGFGNEYEIFAALAQANLNPATDVTLVQQDFDMSGLLSGDIDAAEAMIYNEYAQVLETVNPDTGELYQPSDLNVISYEEVGVGMLQDAIWADGDRLESDDAYRDMAVRFVTASLQGWAYCRDNVQECTDLVVAQGSKLGASHQLWQMNEINQLIWPAAEGVGVIDQEAWDRTAEIAQNTPNLEGTTVLTAPPDAGAYTNDIVNEALANLQDLGVDTTGDSYQPIEVTLNEGGT